MFTGYNFKAFCLHLGIVFFAVFYFVVFVSKVSADIVRFDFTGEIVSIGGSHFVNQNPGDPFSGYFTYDDANNPDGFPSNPNFSTFDIENIVIDGSSFMSSGMGLIINNNSGFDALVIGDAGIHIEFQLLTTDINLFGTDQLTALTTAPFTPFPFPLQFQLNTNSLELGLPFEGRSTGFITSLQQNPVPIPSTMFLLASGVIFMVSLRKKFTNRS